MFKIFKRKSKVLWYCDCCDATLNKQSGFKEKYGLWVCNKCGYPNDVSQNNILSKEEANVILGTQKQCPKCKGHMYIAYIRPFKRWKCENCDYIEENDEQGI